MRAVGHDDVHVEVWKTKLFNKIMVTRSVMNGGLVFSTCVKE